MKLKDLYPLFESYTTVNILEQDECIGVWCGKFPVIKEGDPGAIKYFFDREVVGISGSLEDDEITVRLAVEKSGTLTME